MFSTPIKSRDNVWILGPTTTSNTANNGARSAVWIKPPGFSEFWIIGIGAGRGGTNGVVANSLTNKAGSAGGDAGGIAIGLYSSWMLPDRLYVKTANGTSAALAGAASDFGGSTYVYKTTTQMSGSTFVGVSDEGGPELLLKAPGGGLTISTVNVRGPSYNNGLYRAPGGGRGTAAPAAGAAGTAAGSIDIFRYGQAFISPGSSTSGASSVASPATPDVIANTALSPYLNTLTASNTRCYHYFSLEPLFISSSGSPMQGGYSSNLYTFALNNGIIIKPGPGAGGTAGAPQTFNSLTMMTPASTASYRGQNGGDGMVIIIGIK